MEMILQGKDASNWVYKGEGCANLVVSYCGSSPAFIGKVLRLKKVSRHGDQSCLVFSEHERMLWKDLEEKAASSSKELVGQIYVEHIMRPLLGSQYVDVGMQAFVSQDFLEAVERNVNDQRPDWRVDSSKINNFSDSALVISDLSLFPNVSGGLKEDICIAVEIKPKCGFLPSSGFIAEENVIKKSISRFRMHQALRLHAGEILRACEYDPLDLFSGSIDRINHAIKALFATPQNYFRLFLNGSVIYGGLGGSMEDTVNPTHVKAALEDLIKGVIHAKHGDRLKSLLELVSEIVFRSEILNQLLEAQSLDSFDIEGAIHAYYNILSQPCTVCSNLSGAELVHKYSFFHSLSLEESIKIVREYLIAATAKDCSLMISFRPSLDENSVSKYSYVHLESTKQKFDYKACFIDLDMKPLAKMVPHYELDKKVVKFYTQMANPRNLLESTLNSMDRFGENNQKSTGHLSTI